MKAAKKNVAIFVVAFGVIAILPWKALTEQYCTTTLSTRTLLHRPLGAGADVIDYKPSPYKEGAGKPRVGH